MEKNLFTISYPKDSGFDRTDIYFYQGKPSPEEVYLKDTCDGRQRLFVTDASIFSLESMKEFSKSFTQVECTTLCDGARLFSSGNDLLVVLGSGERFKTLQNVTNIIQAALEHDYNRNCLFIAIGGGVICDMTAFAASIYKRGVEVEFVPTTLLSMVDAAIGGKSGCDYSSYKNMIGSFWPAKKLHVWSDFVLSLPDKEYLSGLGEALKTALLFSEKLCRIFTQEKDKVMARDRDTLKTIIDECACAKAAIVEEDLREHGRRAFLNLGHTFGHALESCAGLGTISHGEAVVWGIGRALDLSANLGLCSEEYAATNKSMLSSYGYDMNPIPSALKGFDGDYTQELIRAMHKDKKNNSNEIRLILQRNYSDTVIQTVSDGEIEKVLK